MRPDLNRPVAIRNLIFHGDDHSLLQELGKLHHDCQKQILPDESQMIVVFEYVNEDEIT